MERPKPSPGNYSHERVAPHVAQLQAEGQLPGNRGDIQPYQPLTAQRRPSERLAGKPPAQDAVSTNPHARHEQAEPQKPKRKRKYTRRKDPEMAYFETMLMADRTKGLTEEQIRISDEAVAVIIRMADADAPREEIRKVKDEYLLKRYPGLTLEEAKKTERDRLWKIYEDMQG